jgi:hypothetical protein
MSDYKDPIIMKVIEALEADGPSVLSGKYLHGDLWNPNKSEMPLCYITKDRVFVEPANNMEDENRHQLVATVVYDWTQDLNAAYDMIAGSGDIFELVEARNADGTLKEDSLLYQIRRGTQLANNMWMGIRSAVEVNYGIGLERRGPGSYSVEATIRFVVTQHLPKPGGD